MTAWAMPIADMNDRVEEPPEEIISSGTPVSGISPVTPPMLNRQWMTKYNAVPTRMILPFSLLIFIA